MLLVPQRIIIDFSNFQPRIHVAGNTNNNKLPCNSLRNSPIEPLKQSDYVCASKYKSSQNHFRAQKYFMKR